MPVTFFFFKQKTAYELRISDWSSDVCSSDLEEPLEGRFLERAPRRAAVRIAEAERVILRHAVGAIVEIAEPGRQPARRVMGQRPGRRPFHDPVLPERLGDKEIGRAHV